MKVLGLCCSSRQGGNTEYLIKEALNGAQQEGAEIEFYSVSGKDIKPCDGCHSCMHTGECHVKDDMQELYKKILESKGIIFGAPSYYYGMASQAKSILDRTTSLSRPGKNMANKVGSVIAVGGSLGLADIMKDIYFYMVSKQMVPANFVAGYGLQKGDVKSLENGIKAARDAGRQIVKIAAQGFEYPADIPGSVFGYGTWNK
jgi:multimeric flavodoxin WrbA